MELNLDLNLTFVPKTISEYLKEVSRVEDGKQKVSKIDDFVKRLEEEMRKIDAFKRELPLCMILLNDAIVRLKEEAMRCKEMYDRAVIEEFLPSKGTSEEDVRVDLENDVSDKRSWMSSVQLWSTNNGDGDSHFKKQDSKSEQKQQRSEEDDDRSTCENPIQLCNYRNKGTGGGGEPFMAFKAFESPERKDEKEVVSQVTGLSLMTPAPPPQLGFCNFTSKSDCGNGTKLQNEPQNQQQQQQLNRKQRRCWSPELHRRFVDALQQLGGSQVATPKQIRELMQVDGLTNDEVKSHLQKYRLHIRKLPASSAAPAGSWMLPDQLNDLSKQNVSQSNSPQGHFHAFGTAKGISSTGDDSMEAQEDDQSESHS